MNRLNRKGLALLVLLAVVLFAAVAPLMAQQPVPAGVMAPRAYLPAIRTTGDGRPTPPTMPTPVPPTPVPPPPPLQGTTLIYAQAVGQPMPGYTTCWQESQLEQTEGCTYLWKVPTNGDETRVTLLPIYNPAYALTPLRTAEELTLAGDAAPAFFIRPRDWPFGPGALLGMTMSMPISPDPVTGVGQLVIVGVVLSIAVVEGQDYAYPAYLIVEDRLNTMSLGLARKVWDRPSPITLGNMELLAEQLATANEEGEPKDPNLTLARETSGEIANPPPPNDPNRCRPFKDFGYKWPRGMSWKSYYKGDAGPGSGKIVLQLRQGGTTIGEVITDLIQFPDQSIGKHSVWVSEAYKKNGIADMLLLWGEKLQVEDLLAAGLPAPELMSIVDINNFFLKNGRHPYGCVHGMYDGEQVEVLGNNTYLYKWRDVGQMLDTHAPEGMPIPPRPIVRP